MRSIVGLPLYGRAPGSQRTYAPRVSTPISNQRFGGLGAPFLCLLSSRLREGMSRWVTQQWFVRRYSVHAMVLDEPCFWMKPLFALFVVRCIFFEMFARRL